MTSYVKIWANYEENVFDKIFQSPIRTTFIIYILAQKAYLGVKIFKNSVFGHIPYIPRYTPDDNRNDRKNDDLWWR